ncbi:beta,beta-carotene 15,15'-dioxygenase-like [Penaeus indicus]|uniref:beta,beta-carotene 15,15'-dioxygenase-like n=1 Tax=Penaeus indicus TaxID=29960 RepID=UPI00300C89A2
MSSYVFPDVPTHTGNGIDVSKTHKACKNIVENLRDSKMDDAHKVYVRSMDQATTTPVKGEVDGEIPLWLEGNLFRNGPGVLNIGDTWYNHLFDGMAVLHKFTIKGGEAFYRSRILESDTYKKNTAANRIVIDEFGTRAYPDPCKTILQRFMSKFSGLQLDSPDVSDNCSVSMCYFSDQLFAMTETSLMRRVDPETLHTVGGRTNITNYVAVNMATAHPHVDPDGTVYNMGTSFTGNKGPTYNIIKFPPKKTLPDVVVKFHVIRRSDGQLLETKYEADTFFFFHSINAYEEDGQIVIDLCCFDDGAVVNQIWLENITNPTETFNKAIQATPRRFVLPLNPQKSPAGTNLVTLPGTKCRSTRNAKGVVHCHSQDLSQDLMEMPRINYRFNGKKYRYGYGFIPTKGLNCGTLCKVDAETGETRKWKMPGFQVSEPVFVERPGATEEDDGALIASLVNEKEQKECCFYTGWVHYTFKPVRTYEFRYMYERDRRPIPGSLFTASRPPS